jgi:AbrB family looped-hinge helix DNA binding protein
MRVTTKGQVTIPIEIRKKLNIGPATEIDFVVGDDDRVYIVRSNDQSAKKRFSRLRGIATVKMSTKEIMALTRSDT